ncbi:MAG: GNAT family N-acetyltransferase [Tistlia sp.]|uniref:N-acetyltransferase family protein n=1 Tax=Tistlia sp. TaxID=3057121 RepID=UPI0034A3B7B7
MTTRPPRLRVRPARLQEAGELCTLLNAIIRIGGTTAHERPLTVEGFAEQFLRGPGFLCCLVAEEAASGLLGGFQALERHAGLPEGWADIATFARPEPKIPGVGTALFAATAARARLLGVTTINATIRADNHGGLAYYSKMGFEDHAVARGVPLADGTPVDRISKRYPVRGTG